MWLHPKEGDDSQAVLSACLRASYSEISEKKKTSVLFGVLSLWATSKKHQLQKRKMSKMTRQLISLLICYVVYVA